MEIETKKESGNSTLNNLVAATVVVLSVFMAVCNIKDGNIVQNMAQAKADSVDHWAQYQATKTKIHINETARAELVVLSTTPAARAAAASAIAGLDRDITKYRAEVPVLAKQAQGLADRYDALNVHDDQFDASEALIATAISMAAVAALAESFWLLVAGWVFGSFGLFMGVCGFAGWAFHPDVLSNFLG